MDDRTMLELAVKPKCAVRGLVRPGAMCGSVIVGGTYCGYKPSVEQIDHLLGLLTAPKDDTEQQDSTQA